MPRPGARALIGGRRRRGGGTIVTPPPPPPASQIYGWNIPAQGASAASIQDPPLLLASTIKADPLGTASIPANQTLTVVNGDYHITSANQVVHNLLVKGICYIDSGASGCVLYFVQADAFLNAPSTNPRFMHCRANGGWDRRTGPLGQAFYWTGVGTRTLAGYKVFRCEVLGACDGSKVQGGNEFTNCWFHDNWYGYDSTQSSQDTHNDGIQGECGDANKVINCFFQSWTFSPSWYGETLNAQGVGPHVAARDATRDWDSGPNAINPSTGVAIPGHVAGHDYHGKQTSSWLYSAPTIGTGGYTMLTNTVFTGNICEGLATKFMHNVENNQTALGGTFLIQSNVFDTQNRDYPQWGAFDHTDTRFTISGNTRPDGTAVT